MRNPIDGGFHESINNTSNNTREGTRTITHNHLKAPCAAYLPVSALLGRDQFTRRISR